MKGGHHNSLPFLFLLFRLLGKLFCVILNVGLPLFQGFHPLGALLDPVKDLKKLLRADFPVLGILH